MKYLPHKAVNERLITPYLLQICYYLETYYCDFAFRPEALFRYSRCIYLLAQNRIELPNNENASMKKKNVRYFTANHFT